MIYSKNFVFDFKFFLYVIKTIKTLCALYHIFNIISIFSKHLMKCFFNFGTVACACIYTSGSASPRQYKHTPHQLNKQKGQRKQTQIELKNKIRRRAKWGFALSRLRKHPLSRLSPYSYSLYIFKLHESGVFFLLLFAKPPTF